MTGALVTGKFGHRDMHRGNTMGRELRRRKTSTSQGERPGTVPFSVVLRKKQPANTLILDF